MTLSSCVRLGWCPTLWHRSSSSTISTSLDDGRFCLKRIMETRSKSAGRGAMVVLPGPAATVCRLSCPAGCIRGSISEIFEGAGHLVLFTAFTTFVVLSRTVRQVLLCATTEIIASASLTPLVSPLFVVHPHEWTIICSFSSLLAFSFFFFSHFFSSSSSFFFDSSHPTRLALSVIVVGRWWYGGGAFLPPLQLPFPPFFSFFSPF